MESNIVTDKTGNQIKVGDTVKCNKAEFVIEEFKFMRDERTLVCGQFGCIDSTYIELIKSK